jgi:isopentenyl diphosphate isomerase/L-lactate dehydrogenase-like FMN-dependent dehydrogenase
MPPIITCIDDFRTLSRSRIPKMAFDFVDGGAGSERGLTRNEDAFASLRLMPRVLAGHEQRSVATSLFGQAYAAPFGIAPTGMSNLVWPQADRALARAAEAIGVPYVISTPATSSLEELSSLAPNNSWFQLYVGRDQSIADDLIDRAEMAGRKVLVLTVDTPVPGRRRRDIRNGLVLPFRLTLRNMIDVLRHPRWALATAKAGAPRFANLEAYAPPGASNASLSSLMAAQSSSRLDWTLVENIRRRWKNKTLVIKGILDRDDARRAVACGADAIIVSNHGGRQLDSAPATIEVLPAIVEAVDGVIPILMEGGIRSGEDIAKALSCGASFVFLGRPFLFSVAALGPVSGPSVCFKMLMGELDTVLCQLGCKTVQELNRTMVRS